MSFKLEQFVSTIDLESILALKKSELVCVVKHYGITCDVEVRKPEIQRALVDWLIDENVISVGSEGKCPWVSEKESAMNEADRQRAFEMDKLRFEAKEREIEHRRQLELKQCDLERVELEERGRAERGSRFDVTKYTKFVPRFMENSVDRYFPQFEKVAENLQWPRDMWTTLLQSALVGRAHEVYVAMPIDRSANYEEVKQAILHAYELVPEAYRQKFRNYRKVDYETYVEFARNKITMFDRWCTSQKINEEYDRLKQLLLIEEFKRCIPNDIKTYLDEHKVTNLDEASKMADEYAITHKSSLQRNYGNSRGSHSGNVQNRGHSGQNYSNVHNRNPNPSESSYSGRGGGIRPNGTGRGTSQGGYFGNNVPLGSGASRAVCAHCGKTGHLMSECWILKRMNADKSVPHAFVSVVEKIDAGLVQDVHMTVGKVEPELPQTRGSYLPFLSKGTVALDRDVDSKSIKILRDTGANQTLMLENVLMLSEKTFTGAKALMQGIDSNYLQVPLHRVYLDSELVKGYVTVGVMTDLPVPGVSLIMGNDIAGGKVVVEPHVVETPSTIDSVERSPEVKESTDVFPSCVVTRAMSREVKEKENVESNVVDLSSTFLSGFSQMDDDTITEEIDQARDSEVDERVRQIRSATLPELEGLLSRAQLLIEQEKDPELKLIIEKACTESESVNMPVCYYVKAGVLMRKWRPPDCEVSDEWRIMHQVVVPLVYREEILSLAHDTLLAGHLGVNKTYNKVMTHFYWPGLQKDVRQYCKTCHTCQMVGKPNQNIPKAPLQPIPAFEEPFSRVLIDCVGPLPRTKTGNEYLLTIMCTSTRFPEAIPLRNIKAKTICKALIHFFTLVGLPKAIQSDQGSNFMSGIFQQVMHELQITQYRSSAYHPESQGALERFHQTLKNMLRAYCVDNARDWDEGVQFVLFAARETVQESLGFSPFELVFGRTVRGPLKLLKEKWLAEDSDLNLLDYVSQFKDRFIRAGELAKTNLETSQTKMKTWYDKGTLDRQFKPGESVLVLLPISGQPLKARYCGPYVVRKKVNDTDYVIDTPDRRKARRLCHVNMLKAYHDRNDDRLVETVCVATVENEHVKLGPDIKLTNTDVLNNLDSKLVHVIPEQREEFKALIQEYAHLFPDVPSQTTLVQHDIDVGDSLPIKQHAYRLNPLRLADLRVEIQYMLDNGILEHSNSPWSSPCLLVPKSTGGIRVVTDFKKINNLCTADSYPIPRIDDCIDRIGNAKFVCKFDLLKGYWQIPLTDRAKQISAMVTPEGLFQYKVMPFGLKNAPATFQRLINQVTAPVAQCEAYIDDIIVATREWQDMLSSVRHLFEQLTEAKLTINLSKCEFAQATVTYLGHVVGQGEVRPVQAKIEAVNNYTAPTNRKELLRFLGMAGYYRKFCRNFSQVCAPLTELLKKNRKFVWTTDQDRAFKQVKSILTNVPVLIVPDFEQAFKIYVDASDLGAGAVLQQEDDQGIDHPVCYFSKKFDKHQKNYSTVEKETLALLLTLQHCIVYLNTTAKPIIVYTDHNPLVFVSKMRNKNQRLMRWSLQLEEFNLDIRHIRGRDNVMADALSRI